MAADLGDLVQRVALDALATDDDERSRRLEDLRPALRQLRKDYAAGRAPDFSQPEMRKAYVFAYLPSHAVLAAASYAAAGAEMLGLDGDEARVVVLGAGPGPEVLGMAQALAQRSVGLRRVGVDLVDREPAWARARATIMDAALPALWGGEIEVGDHVADLSTSAGLERVRPLLAEATLVVAETILTELPDPDRPGAVIDHLHEHIGADTRLLVIDLQTLPRFRASVDRLHSRDLVAWMDAQVALPAARNHPLVEAHLFANEDRLRPRRNLHCGVRAMGRPGRRPLPASANPFTPTAGQHQVLGDLDRFFAGPGRVFVLRGTAGTGKTSLFPAIIRCAAGHGLPARLLAPTGQAARRLGARGGPPGSTVHSAVYRFAQNEPDDDEDRPPVAVFGRAEPLPDPCVYVIDEASMVGDRPYEREARDQADVRFGEGRLLSDLLAFCLGARGSKVVLVGDPAQLAPVGEDESPALDAEALRLLLDGEHPVVAELDEVVRQGEGSAILALAHHARDATHRDGLPLAGDDPEAAVRQLTSPKLPSWLAAEVLDGRAAVIAVRNADVAAWNGRIRQAAGRPADQPVSGDRLSVVRTDPLTGLVNGDELEVADAAATTATVTLGEDSVRLRRAGLRKAVPGLGHITFNAMIVDDLLQLATTDAHRRITRVLYVDFLLRSGLKPGQPGFDEARASDERVNALRATYAYARTGHRAQGGEWENVVVDFAASRQLGPQYGRWAYTALTRARRAAWLLHVPRAQGPMGPEALVAGAAMVLEAHGLELHSSRPIQHGVKLTIGDGASTVAIDLYEKKGRPSSPVRSGSPNPKLSQRAIEALREWIEQEGRDAEPPLPAALAERAARLRETLEVEGYDLDVLSPAEYQVRFTLTGGTQAASIAYWYKAGGALGAEIPSAGGDLLLQGRLRAALDGASP